MADDKTSLVPNPYLTSTEKNAIYHDSGQGPRARAMQVLFVAVVVIMVLVCIILSIYRGIHLGEDGGLYFMLGISLIGFVAVEIVLILFIRRGELPKEKTWFLYFLGGCVILEAIFTDVLLFD